MSGRDSAELRCLNDFITLLYKWDYITIGHCYYIRYARVILADLYKNDLPLEIEMRDLLMNNGISKTPWNQEKNHPRRATRKLSPENSQSQHQTPDGLGTFSAYPTPGQKNESLPIFLS